MERDGGNLPAPQRSHNRAGDERQIFKDDAMKRLAQVIVVVLVAPFVMLALSVMAFIEWLREGKRA